MAQEARKNSPKIEGLNKQLEEVKKRLGFALTEYKRVRDALAQAQAENARLRVISRLLPVATRP